MTTAVPKISSVDEFIRSDADGLRGWMTERGWQLGWTCVAVIIAGSGIYGAVMGSWWAPLQVCYVAVKLPLLIFLTTLGNGLLNGMLAPLLGLRLTFRQCLSAVLVSFAITSAILGALAPVALFVVWNTPPLSGSTNIRSVEYGFLQLALVVFIAFAGVAGNVKLLPLLERWSASAGVARRVLFAWLAGNLFLGSQICWVLRPFIWDASGKVEFVGPNCFHGSFFETVFEATRRLLMS